ncbi:MAG: hypothetical protein ACLP2P_01535 [Desulfobaccales bacterium]
MADYHGSIRGAIESALRERDQLLDKLKEFDRLKEQLGQIEAFINQGRLLLGDEPKNVDTHKPKAGGLAMGPFLSEKTNPEKILEILKATGRAMTVPQIVNEFRARNLKLSEKNRMQIIRNALKSKEGLLFKKVDIGLWDLMDRAA